MKLRKSQLINFQSHKETTLEFADGLNVIVGPTDSGKSSFFRGIGWPITNRPIGDSFVSDWLSKNNTVSLLEFDDLTILRSKKDKDGYRIIQGDKIEKFHALKGQIPDQVQKALSLSEINLQSQHNPHFLLSNSPGEVAKELNKLVDLEIIDSSLKHANSRIKQLNTQKNQEELEIFKLNEILFENEWAKEADKKLSELEDLDLEIESIINKYNSILGIYEEYDKISKTLQSFKPVENLYKLVQELESIGAFWKEEVAKKNILVSIVAQLDSCNQKLKRFSNVQKPLGLLEEIEDLRKKIEDKSFVSSQLKFLVKDFNFNTELIKDYLLKIENHLIELKELMGDLCPLCGNQLQYQNQLH